MASADSLTVRSPAELDVETGHVEVFVHGVVLAAGASDRYGTENKLLRPFEGEPRVAHATRTAVRSAVSGVTVVVGYEREKVASALDEFAVEIRHNDEFARGQSVSVACGVEAASERSADAAIFFLGDMPNVAVETVDLLVDVYAGTSYRAIAPVYEGQRGNPVLFDSEYFDVLGDVEGDVGGRDILLGAGDAIGIETGDPGVLEDVDEPSDI
jgi:molybdenum cofactor cytidylyltransferase